MDSIREVTVAYELMIEIYEMHQSGAKYADIQKKYNITYNKASDIVQFVISAESKSKKTGIKYDRMIGLFLVDKRLSNKLSWRHINSLDALYKYIKNPKVIYEWCSDIRYIGYMPDFSERDITKLNKLMGTDLFLVYNRLVTRDIYNRILEKDLLLKSDKYMEIVSSTININSYYEYDRRGLYISEKGVKAIKEEVRSLIISDLITNMIKEEQE